MGVLKFSPDGVTVVEVGSGNVGAPANIADHAIVRGAGGGTEIQDSTVTIADNGVVSIPGIGDGGITDHDLNVGGANYGMIKMGDASFGRTSYKVGSIDLDGAILCKNTSGPVTGEIEFIWAESTGGSARFALPKSGVGNATYNSRSMLIAGPAPADTDFVKVTYWQGQGIFDNLVCDTSGVGADLGVQHDLEVEGTIYTDNIQESTPAAGITVAGDLALGANDIVSVGTIANHIIGTDVQAYNAKTVIGPSAPPTKDRGIVVWDGTFGDSVLSTLPTIGSGGNMVIDVLADVIPLTLKGHTTQTSKILIAETQGGSADLLTLDNSGNLGIGGAVVVLGGTLELLKFSATGSAVNEFTIANAATGSGPTLSATGGDANIDINLAPKGTGTIVLAGNLTTTGRAIVDAGNIMLEPAGITPLVVIGSGAAGVDYGLMFNGQTNDGIITWNEGLGFFLPDSSFRFPDNIELYFGSGTEAGIWYDGTHLRIDPQLTAGGDVVFGDGATDMRIDGSARFLLSGGDAVAAFVAGGASASSTGGKLFLSAKNAGFFGARHGSFTDVAPAGHAFVIGTEDNGVHTAEWDVKADHHFTARADGSYHKWGTGEDCGITYDGTDMIINPALVGTGVCRINNSDSWIANGTGTVTISDLAPSGLSATISKWLCVKDDSGNKYLIEARLYTP